jgi:hypothetical protein
MRRPCESVKPMGPAAILRAYFVKRNFNSRLACSMLTAEQTGFSAAGQACSAMVADE